MEWATRVHEKGQEGQTFDIETSPLILVFPVFHLRVQLRLVLNLAKTTCNLIAF